jgi:hypothetical protein
MQHFQGVVVQNLECDVGERAQIRFLSKSHTSTCQVVPRPDIYGFGGQTNGGDGYIC